MGLKANIVKAVNEITVKVDEILQSEASLENPHADTSELETTIDALVYKLDFLQNSLFRLLHFVRNDRHCEEERRSNLSFARSLLYNLSDDEIKIIRGEN